MKKFIAYFLTSTLLLTAFFQMQAQQVSISLKINEETEASVYQDEAVLLDVAVFNRKAQSDGRWNRAGEERMEELSELLRLGKIKQEDYDREKTSIEKARRKSDPVTLGTASSPWTSSVSWKIINTANRNNVELPLKLMKKPATGGEALLDADGYYMACYGISPETMRSVPPGSYAIECIINNMFSNAVLLIVKGGMMNEQIAGSEPVLLRAGRYFWHDEDGVRTIQYADRILSRDPVSLDGLSLKADGQILEKQYLPALETYNMAVKEYYRQNGSGAEPPEYLVSMISYIKKQMTP